jgi:hypothetical protein
MLKWLESPILWGIILIVGGIAFLFQNLGYFQFGSIFWAIVLVLAGFFFLTIFFTSRSNWWSLIPGITLLSVAFLILTEAFLPRVGDIWGGSIVLGGIATSFLVVYLVDRKNWWAIIPAGVLYTLAVVAGLDNFYSGVGTGGIFFIGLGLTFAVLALLPVPEGRLGWAWIPAVILFIMGLLIFAAAERFIGYLWPLALILVGGYFIFKTLLRK